jgi:hypothetical protein
MNRINLPSFIISYPVKVNSLVYSLCNVNRLFVTVAWEPGPRDVTPAREPVPYDRDTPEKREWLDTTEALREEGVRAVSSGLGELASLIVIFVVALLRYSEAVRLFKPSLVGILCKDCSTVYSIGLTARRPFIGGVRITFDSIRELTGNFMFHSSLTVLDLREPNRFFLSLGFGTLALLGGPFPLPGPQLSKPFSSKRWFLVVTLAMSTDDVIPKPLRNWKIEMIRPNEIGEASSIHGIHSMNYTQSLSRFSLTLSDWKEMIYL